MSRPWNSPLAEQLILVNRRVRQGSVIITVAGDINAITAPRLRATLHEALHSKPTRRVIADLRGVLSLAPAGLIALVQAAREAAQRREPIRVVANQTLQRQVLSTQPDPALTLYHSIAEALQTYDSNTDPHDCRRDCSPVGDLDRVPAHEPDPRNRGSRADAEPEPPGGEADGQPGIARGWAT